MAEYTFSSSGGAVSGYSSILLDDTGEIILDDAGNYIETDTYYSRLCNAIGRGGVLCGGGSGFSVYEPGRLVSSGGCVVGLDGLLRDDSGEAITDDSGQFVESDTYTNRYVKISALGGAVFGGGAESSSVTPGVFAASGGVVVGYDGLLRDSHGEAITGSDGQYIEVDTYFNRASVFSAEGGGILSGSADSSYFATARFADFAASGGCISSFDTSSSRLVNVTPVNGGVVSGSSINSAGVSVSSSGGASVGGAAKTGFEYTIIGGAVASGDCSVLNGKVFISQSLSVCGGDAGHSKSLSVSAVNGCLAGGYSTVNISKIFESSAGSVSGGNAIVYQTNRKTYLAEGGSVISGGAVSIVKDVFAGSAGAVVNGAYIDGRSGSHIADGGARCGGYALFRVNDYDIEQFISSGGCRVGGSSAVARSYVLPGAGGAVVSATASFIYGHAVGDGSGAVVGYDGIVRDDAGDPITDSEGQYIETDVYFNRSVAFAGTGGTVASGTAARTPLVVLSASGWGVCAALAALSRKVSCVPTGGAESAGTVVSVSSVIRSAAGGVTGGGAREVAASIPMESSGGGVASGAATISTVGGLNYSQVADGGLVASGSSVVSVKTIVPGSSGAISGGETVRGKGYAFASAGGCVSSGAASVSMAVNHDYNGGSVSGGASANSVDGGLDIVHITSGGAVCNGECGRLVIVGAVSNGGALSGGGAQSVKVRDEVASGGVACGGTSPYYFSRLNLNGTVGVIAGGEAKNVSKRKMPTAVFEFYRAEQASTFYRDEQVVEFYPDTRIVEFELEKAA